MIFLVDCFYGGGKEDGLEVAKRSLGGHASHPQVQWAKGSGRERAPLQGEQGLPQSRAKLARDSGSQDRPLSSDRAGAGAGLVGTTGCSESLLYSRPSRPCSRSAGQQSGSVIKPTMRASFFHNIFHSNTP